MEALGNKSGGRYFSSGEPAPTFKPGRPASPAPAAKQPLPRGVPSPSAARARDHPALPRPLPKHRLSQGTSESRPRRNCSSMGREPQHPSAGLCSSVRIPRPCELSINTHWCICLSFTGHTSDSARCPSAPPEGWRCLSISPARDKPRPTRSLGSSSPFLSKPPRLPGERRSPPPQSPIPSPPSHNRVRFQAGQNGSTYRSVDNSQPCDTRRGSSLRFERKPSEPLPQKANNLSSKTCRRTQFC